jgi:DNA repair exonuclease SbcCD ATPase subunit
MQLTRLYLRNYRVYEDELDLALPPGLVGIYGANGTGKSYLLESVLWTLFGRTRTDKRDVRTSGVNAECVTEVEFEHEGHLYLVRRTITGVNSTVKAEAHADRLQVAEGITDTRTYVHSILGMDDAAFRASVFAEQKQLTAFSLQAPNERKKLVLQLLGITPLDAARDLVRKDARLTQEQFKRTRELLPDVTGLEVAAVDAEQRALTAEAAVAPLAHELTDFRTRLEAAQTRADDLDGVGREYESLTAEGRGVRAEHDRAAQRVAALEEEVAALDAGALRLVSLEPDAAGLSAAETRLRLVEALAEAERKVAQLTVDDEPPPPDDAGHDAARAAADAAREALADVGGRISAAVADASRARDAVDRSKDLSGEADCPVCGQALGDAFEQVQAHRAAEVAQAEERTRTVQSERVALAATAEAAESRARELAAELKAAQQARTAWEKRRDKHVEAEAARAEALTRLDPPPVDGEAEGLAAEVARRRQAAEECRRLEGRLERRSTARQELESERERLAGAAGRLEMLREKVRALAFKPDDLVVARAARAEAAAAADEASSRAQAAELEATQARAQAQAAADRLADGQAQHERIVEVGEEARHLGRTAELMGTFRNTVVGTVGPRLSAQAAELFAELTDHEYDDLQVDPETYEIRIVDRGVEYGMDRFSGSETDLANLALRVAISEHVRFQSGGAVGLLVLDEVFGSLDPDRKARMLMALERLRGRFRQVLVVTHDADIKEELPHAIEVVETRPRRATARVVAG